MRRCQALDIHGKRCGQYRNVTPVNYHGDHEIYDYSEGDEPKWVVAYLCKRHCKPASEVTK